MHTLTRVPSQRPKTTVKTTVAKVPQPQGGALNAGGTPGNKGGPGRTPDAFKKWMQGLASGVDASKGIRDILRAGKKDPLFLGALKHVTEHGYGKPGQDITSGGKPLVPSALNIRVVKPNGGG